MTPPTRSSTVFHGLHFQRSQISFGLLDLGLSQGNLLFSRARPQHRYLAFRHLDLSLRCLVSGLSLGDLQLRFLRILFKRLQIV